MTYTIAKVLPIKVPSMLRGARNTVKDIPADLFDFCDFLADIAEYLYNLSEDKNQEFTSQSMIHLLEIGLNDLFKENCKFLSDLEFPENLKGKYIQILSDLSYFPLIIDEICSKDFAKQFRAFFFDIFHEAIPPRMCTKARF